MLSDGGQGEGGGPRTREIEVALRYCGRLRGRTVAAGGQGVLGTGGRQSAGSLGHLLQRSHRPPPTPGYLSGVTEQQLPSPQLLQDRLQHHNFKPNPRSSLCLTLTKDSQIFKKQNKNTLPSSIIIPSYQKTLHD